MQDCLITSVWLLFVDLDPDFANSYFIVLYYFSVYIKHVIFHYLTPPFVFHTLSSFPALSGGTFDLFSSFLLQLSV